MSTTNLNIQATQLTGLERLERFEQQQQREGMADNLDYRIEDYAPGKVSLSYTPKARHMNLLGSLHGGVLASLLDTAMGCAVMTLLEVGERHTMTDLNCKFIRAVFTADHETDSQSQKQSSDAMHTIEEAPTQERLNIHAHVDHSGRRLLSTESTIVNAKGQLIAKAMASAIRL